MMSCDLGEGGSFVGIGSRHGSRFGCCLRSVTDGEEGPVVEDEKDGVEGG